MLANLASLTIFMQIIYPEMGQHVGEYDDFGDFYANYIMSYPSRAERQCFARVEEKAIIFLF